MGVFIHGRSVLHKGDGQIQRVSAPDVCKTPSPNGPVPAPYFLHVNTSQLKHGSRKVLVEGDSVVLDGSRLQPGTGDEAGSLGGVVSGTVKGAIVNISSTFDVLIEGKGVVCFAHPLMFNTGSAGNTMGLASGSLSLPTPEAPAFDPLDEEGGGEP